MVINQSTLSVSLIVHHNNQGVKTAEKQHLRLLLQNRKKIRNEHIAIADRAAVTETYIFTNQRTFSVSLIVHRNNKGVKTAKSCISAFCSESEINQKYAYCTSQ